MRQQPPPVPGGSSGPLTSVAAIAALVSPRRNGAASLHQQRMVPMNSFLLVAPAAPRRTAPIRFGLAATLLAVVAPAQIWQQVQPAVRPALRLHHCMAFDAARDVVVLFGGRGLVWPNAPDDT